MQGVDGSSPFILTSVKRPQICGRFSLRSKKAVRVTVDGEVLLAVNCVQNADQTVTMTGESFIIYKK